MKNLNYCRVGKIFCVILACLVAFGVSACKNNTPSPAPKAITVTLLNGEHYSVIGENKQEITSGGKAEFDVKLERGYKISGAYGDKYNIEITENVSFEQRVSFTDIYYKSTLRLETTAMDITEFSVQSKNDAMCDIVIDSVLDGAAEDKYYTEDVLDISVAPNDGYRFQCWSTGNYLAEGGSFYSYDPVLENFDFNNIPTLYANIKDMSDTGNEIFYIMGDGVEIEHDCTEMLANHPRANTYIAEDLRAKGIDCDSRMLIGWQTTEGRYIGLGSRVAVSDKEATILYPVWKEYTDKNEFEIAVEDGKGVLKKYVGTPDNGEIVIPNEIDGVRVTTIGEEAFVGCQAATYYLPDTVETVKDNAFYGCESLIELYMCDNITDIKDKAFTGCKNFTTLHINAALRPRYIAYKEAVKANIFDLLALNVDSEKRNFVILGGSSVSHGYTRDVIMSEFEQAGYEAPNVYNLGWNASLCSVPQFEMILPYLRPDDILLHAPEHYTGSWGGVLSDSILTYGKAIYFESMIYEYVIAESNWDLVSGLTINKYSGIFTCFKDFNDIRLTLSPASYSDMWYNQNEYGFNIYGEEVNPECGEDKKFWNSGCEINPDYDEIISRTKSNIYKAAIDKGVKMFLTFAPVCKQDILTKYNTEEDMSVAAESYTNKLNELLSDLDGLNIILTQSDTIYDSSHFSNHPYHLGSPFKNEHTRRVVTALIDSLKKSAQENMA